MTDPALAAEAARLERLLYSRLAASDRERLEAEYAAVRSSMIEADHISSADPRAVSTAPTAASSTVDPVETSSRRLPLVIAAVALALVLGGIVGWSLSARTDGSNSAGIPAVLARPQVITADDSSDIPPMNLGSSYEASTFRHLKVLTAPGVGQEPLGNVYGVVRSKDRAICFVVVSRSDFIASTCVAPSDIPAAGIALSVSIRSVEFSMTWRADGTVTAAGSAL